ncbi:MAG: hypothetical protein P8H13_07375 [Polaribacter sp.]|nr:hypothetical protein [Polaribacter sp.]MDG1811741.1 hypothetical protein [Polaribacter sp.]MDG1994714.1 hypothetical protein [Polaribacter sp.]
MYFEVFQNVYEAVDRENQLKNWNRQWKIDLFEKENKKWQDLAFDWFDDILND